MAKQSGLGDNFYLSGYDLSGDVGSIDSVAGGPTPMERTGINKLGFERLGGLLNAGMGWSTWFNDAASQQHARLSLLPRTDQLATYCRGTTLGKPAANLLAKQVNYDGTRGNDGGLAFEIEAQGAAGVPLEWG